MDQYQKEYFEEKFENIYRMFKEHKDAHGEEHLRINKALEDNQKSISTLSKFMWGASAVGTAAVILFKLIS